MANPLRRVIDFWLEEIRTATTWQTGRRHFAARVLVTWAIEIVGLVALARIVPGLVIHDLGSAAAGVVILSLVNALLRPILIYLTLPFTVLSFGLLTFVLNALMLVLADRLVPGIEVQGPLAAILGGIGLAAINTIVAAFLALDEEESFYRNVVKRLARRSAGAIVSETPGVVIIQIDGLSAGVLRQAIRTGLVPNIARWVRTGSHRLVGWESGLPSGTSASQAGILHGRVDDIPAFRWYEKENGRLLVSNRPADAAEIERRLSDGAGLLAAGGSSVGNLFSGDAPRSVLTMSSIADVSAGIRRRSRDFFYYLLNPYSVARGFFHMIGEVVIELFEARRQRLRDVQPRVSRAFPFPFLRAVSCVLLRDITVSLLIEDMYRGVSCTFADFVGYDEVAHHAGPERPEAIRVLEEIDQEIGSLERAAQGAPRPYRFVILSDHGQTQGATFWQRYRVTLEELVSGLAGGATVEAITGSTEGWGHLNAVVSELVAGEGTGSRVVRRSVRRRIRDGYVEFGPRGRQGGPAADAGLPEVVVCASGNLGLVYFNSSPERLSLEEINELYPKLIQGLIAHPGIGFVLVRSEDHGPLVIGARGVHHLRDDKVEGHDPIGRLGKHAADHLRRLDSYAHVGDLVVNSLYDHATDEVAAFEELVGSHGGLGGPQMQPFLLFPTDWDTEDPEIVGPVELHAVLRRWVERTVVAPVDELAPAARSA